MPAGSGTTGSGTTGSGTTGSSPPGPEICGDGIDNDQDGFIDCEDVLCAALPECLEALCEDGLDDDGDGFIDCEDADCWGDGAACGVRVSTLEQAASASLFWHQHERRWTTSMGDCDGSSSQYGSVWLQEPGGTILLKEAGANTWVSCAWSAASSGGALSRAQLIFNNGDYPDDVFDNGMGVRASEAVLVRRNGLALDPACPVQDADLLAKWWVLAPTEPGHQVRGGQVGQGPVLWSVGMPTATAPTWFGSGALTCHHNDTYQTSATFQTVQGGAGYPSWVGSATP